MDIAHDLALFDRGWRSADTSLEGRVNIPTALHSMRVHGRLREVKVVLHVPEIVYHPHPDATIGKERTVPAYYLPMARLQLAHWAGHDVDESDVSDAAAVGEEVTRTGRAVVAPVFLASRAFQSGFLLLLRMGGFGKVTLHLEYVSRTGERRVEATDMAEFCKYWLGTTVLEVLTEAKAHEVGRGKWIDPFATSQWADSGKRPSMEQNEGVDTGALQILQYIAGDDVEEPDIATGEDGEVDQETQRNTQTGRDDLTLSSPVRYSPTPSSSSLTDEVKMDLEAFIQAGEAEGEATQVEVEPEHDFDAVSASGSDTDTDTTDVFSACLETAISDAVTNASTEILQSLRQPVLRGRERMKTLSEYGDVVPDSQPGSPDPASDTSSDDSDATPCQDAGGVTVASRTSSCACTVGSDTSSSDAQADKESKVSGNDKSTPMAKVVRSNVSRTKHTRTIDDGSRNREGDNEYLEPSTQVSQIIASTTFLSPPPATASLPVSTPASLPIICKKDKMATGGAGAGSGQKRKAPYGGQESRKLSKKARRRANKRDREQAATAGSSACPEKDSETTTTEWIPILL